MRKSKRQQTVQTSTFRAEFKALRTAVENTVMIHYYLRSMGVKVSKPSTIYADNEGVFLNSVSPASFLNKNFLALSYHFVQEHVANNVIKIVKINSKDNYADPFTKGMGVKKNGAFISNIMRN